MRGAMGDMQHFCLRWNNYQSSITSAFENLRDDEDFVDVTLACDGKSLKAHRVVLSACSPYFRELLKSTPCKHPVIVLQDVMFEDLHALVEFIYHGEVNVRQRSLSSFLKTAEVLRVSGLTQQSEAVSMGLDRGGGLADGRGSPYHPRKSVHKHRERPNSTNESMEHQDNAMPMKRPKTEPTNNHGERSPREDMEEPPMDFSTSGNNNTNLRDKHDVSPPAINSDIKPEPIELTPHIHNEREDSNDSGGEVMSEGGGVTISGGGSGGGGGGAPQGHTNMMQDHEDSIQSTHNYLDSKLFAGAGFNFSMAAALAADSLAGLNNQPHGLGSSDSLAGTSQQVLAMPPPLSGGINEPQDCPYCRRTFSCYYSLKRHFQDKHERSDTLYVCEFCHRRYRTKNSLTTHKSLQHRGTSGMLKRLLKTTAAYGGQPPL
ncbi:broad-complex core protein isoforms 1/2/3/4/5 isoform X2 [Cimex lectularius]|uniref:Broad n=1 Tax=Cimex lectularius TaxID=79782 RepID=A0A8I6TG54_CIMLE|nr:broad-complex core protein isoforms 1/2/3/4/5 isoform X2 [Cimex lectularius]